MNSLLTTVLVASCLAGPPVHSVRVQPAATDADSPAPPVTALAFAPDGRSLVTGSQRGIEVRSWPGLSVVRSIETGLVQIHDLAFSPDGTRLAVAGGVPAEDGAVEIYGWPAGERLYTADGHSDVVYGLAWSGDSAFWAAASHDGTLTLRDGADGTVLAWLEGHSGGVKCVVFLPEPGEMLVSGGLDGTLRVWSVGDVIDRARTVRAPEAGHPNHRAPHGTGATGGAPTIDGRKVRAPTEGAPADSAPTDSAPVVRARDNADPELRARNTGSPELRAPGDDAPERRARMVRALTNHTGGVHHLALRPEAGPGGRPDRPALPWVASVAGDRTVRLWQPTIGRMVRFVRLSDAVPLAVGWTVDGGRLLAASSDGRLRVIDPGSAAVLREVAAVEGWAYSLAVHPAGREAAVGGERGQVVRVRLPEEP